MPYLSSGKPAGKSSVSVTPSVNSFKKGVQRFRVLTITTRSKRRVLNDQVWTGLKGLDKAENPPQETSDSPDADLRGAPKR